MDIKLILRVISSVRARLRDQSRTIMSTKATGLSDQSVATERDISRTSKIYFLNKFK